MRNLLTIRICKRKSSLKYNTGQYPLLFLLDIMQVHTTYYWKYDKTYILVNNEAINRAVQICLFVKTGFYF